MYEKSSMALLQGPSLMPDVSETPKSTCSHTSGFPGSISTECSGNTTRCQALVDRPQPSSGLFLNGPLLEVLVWAMVS